MVYLHNSYESKSKVLRGFAQAMLCALEKKYARLISVAEKEWECKFAGTDPSDACVTVRIIGADSREFTNLFPLELEPSIKN